MSYLVLARKWRPTTFDEVVGQNHVTQTLKNAIKLNRVAHALLFTGSRGIGKTSCARILAKALNCEMGPTATPCGQCNHCIDIADGRSVDVFEVDGASNNSVEQIREIRESVKFVPASGRRKVYIIDEVHMLSTSAFNALLKTLEEPPEHVLFIFATTEPHKIPDTILSRCQRYDFKRISEGVLVDALADIASKEDIKIDRAALGHIAREANGGMRDSLSLFDQVIAFAGMTITESEVTDVLGIAGRQVFRTLVDAVYKGDGQTVLSVVEAQHSRGLDLVKFANELLRYVRDLMVIRVCPDPGGMVDLPAEELDSLRDFVAQFAPATLHRMLNRLMKGADEVSRSSFPRISLEMTLLAVCHQGVAIPIAEVLTKLGALSAGLPAPDQTSAADVEPPSSAAHFSNELKVPSETAPKPSDRQAKAGALSHQTKPALTSEGTSTPEHTEAVPNIAHPPWETGPVAIKDNEKHVSVSASPIQGPTATTEGPAAKHVQASPIVDDNPEVVSRAAVDEKPESLTPTANAKAESPRNESPPTGFKKRPSDENYDDFSATPPAPKAASQLRALAVKPRIGWAISEEDVAPFRGRPRAVPVETKEESPVKDVVRSQDAPHGGAKEAPPSRPKTSVDTLATGSTESASGTDNVTETEVIASSGIEPLNLNDGRESIEHLAAVIAVIRSSDVFAASEMIQVIHLVRFDSRVLALAMNAHHFSTFGETCESLLASALKAVGLVDCELQMEPCEDGHPKLTTETIFARQQRLDMEHRAHRKALVKADENVNHALEVLGGELIDVKLCSPQTAKEG